MKSFKEYVKQLGLAIKEDVLSKSSVVGSGLERELEIIKTSFHKELEQLKRKKEIQKAIDPEKAETEYQRNSQIAHDKNTKAIQNVYTKHGRTAPNSSTYTPR